MRSLILILIFSVVSISANPVLPENQDGVSNEIVPSENKDGNLENLQNGKIDGIVENPVLQTRMMKSIGSSTQIESKSHKKSKLKKLLKKAFLPIIIFILVKAMILLPLALAILGFKTWNAIQLGFVSFVTAIGLAIWKFCTKVSETDHPTVIHGGWDLDRGDPQLLAYNGYVP